jgi:hypothetical protein
MEQYRRAYNHARPHSSLQYHTSLRSLIAVPDLARSDPYGTAKRHPWLSHNPGPKNGGRHNPATAPRVVPKACRSKLATRATRRHSCPDCRTNNGPPCGGPSPKSGVLPLDEGPAVLPVVT